MDTKIVEKYSKTARQNLIANEKGPFLTCDWVKFVFLHYEVAPEFLRPNIPCDLHLFENKAYVSVVAFTLENFRFARGGNLTKWITAPVATHRYFNVRTYVREGKEKGIYFINEWISHPLCSFVALQVYGLPCHYGNLDYQHDYLPCLKGNVNPKNIKGEYQYEIEVNSILELKHVEEGSLDEFLLERYIAYAKGRGKKKYFRVWHKPWLQTTVDIRKVKDELMPKLGEWGKEMKLIKGHYSPGIYGVWMGKPQVVVNDEGKSLL